MSAAFLWLIPDGEAADVVKPHGSCDAARKLMQKAVRICRKNVLRVPKFLINFALRVKTIKTFPADEPEQFGFNR